MQLNKITLIACLAIPGLFLLSCTKHFLDAPPTASLAVPSTVEDYQSLLDNGAVFNNAPGWGDVSCDNYYLTYPVFQQQIQILYFYNGLYTWNENTFVGGTGTGLTEWYTPYNQVYTANVVLQGLPGVAPTASTLADWNWTMGTALYYRAFYHYELAQEFGEPYTPASASTDLGIPVRLSPDLDAPCPRSTVKETYAQIILDLKNAIPYVPNTVPPYVLLNRPTKLSIMGLLARIYLTMQDYTDAFNYADSCLGMYNALLDYNTVDAAPTPTFNMPDNNPEVLIQCSSLYFGIDNSQAGEIDTVLYTSYDSNDLRKSVFFRLSNDGTFHRFRGGYNRNSPQFHGVANDELYLIRAECNARNGQVNAAMNDLNTLLSYRWKTGTFSNFTATDAADALRQIIGERRKELLYRGQRWTDLRRLNQDPAFAVTLTRILNGTTYTLPPNDKRYTFLIPADEIEYNPMPQTPR